MKYSLANREIETKLPAFVMGILNVTPDSFWKESRGGVEHAFELIEDGADLLDIGGESSRPGSDYVSAEDEIKRIVPVIEAIRKESNIPISVDTRKYEVMKAAFEAGADILNDISALEDDDRLTDYAKSTKMPIILMHKRGTPIDMQNNTSYSNVFDEVSSYLSKRAAYAISKGIDASKIIVDPGVGFGKDVEGNFSLIRDCGKLCDGKFPVLMALSRKSCIGAVTNRDVQDRLSGTLTANLLSVLSGAFMVRVHDVKETVDSLKVLNAVKNM